VTSNPSLRKSIADSNDYDEQTKGWLYWEIRELYEEPVVEDARVAADILRLSR
jgi:hypothetical protein